MSRRAAGRHYAISESVAIKVAWSALSAKAHARACRTWRPSCFQAHAAPGLSGGRARREIGHHASGSVQIACRPSAGSKLDTSMMSRFFRKIGVTVKKKTLVAREQDRART